MTSSLANAVLALCTCGRSQSKVMEKPKPKRKQSWYQVRQEPESNRYVVHAAPQPEDGVEEEERQATEGGATSLDLRRTADSRRSRCHSEQALPQDEATSLEPSMCQICFAEPANAVMLPCRHGDICTSCVRRAMFMKPIHKGGGVCPLCRRRIKQVVCVTADSIDTPSILPRQGMALSVWGRAAD